MSERYTIGVDFGTQSARAAVISAADGAVISTRECAYAHGVWTDTLPTGEKLPANYALQHPQDYLDALFYSVSSAVAQSGVDPQGIAGLAMDFTCTLIPLGKNGVPLCFDKRFARRPHAWIKLWKHHGAQLEAEELTRLFEKEDPEILAMYGGRISSESFFAKLLEVFHEDRVVFDAADRFVEVGDWLSQYLTGTENRSLSMAAFKAFYREGVGYPPCLLEKEPEIKAAVGTKLRGRFLPPASVFGRLTQAAAEKLGVPAGIPVATPMFDGHAALPASGIRDESAALLSLGTSSCVILAYPDFRAVKGVCSIARDGILPGYYAYASGQAGFGDTLAWFASQCVPAQVENSAGRNQISIHEELSIRAEKLRPGESGLLALDWWNGSKALADTSLSGLMLGMTLQTKPEEMYLALLESLAFGLRYILERYRDAGIVPKALCLGGGIAYKNPFLVQLISDVTRMPLIGTKPLATPAVGMAMTAAVAAGAYETLFDAVERMNCISGVSYTPREERSRAYDPLYTEYLALSRYFSAGENGVMRRLRALSQEVRAEKQANLPVKS